MKRSADADADVVASLAARAKASKKPPAQPAAARKTAEVGQNGPAGGTNGAIDLSSLNSLTPHSLPDREWPEPLAPEAFIGPFADYVRAVEPATESDITALLIHLLVMFGNGVGRNA